MSDAGPIGPISARARFLAEVGERTQLLRELSDQLADNPDTPAARGALRHRLQTLQVSAAAIGQASLSQHAEAALACLQSSQDPTVDDKARHRALQELRELIDGLPNVASDPDWQGAGVRGAAVAGSLGRDRDRVDVSQEGLPRTRRDTPHVADVTAELARAAFRDAQDELTPARNTEPSESQGRRTRRNTLHMATGIPQVLAQAAEVEVGADASEAGTPEEHSGPASPATGGSGSPSLDPRESHVKVAAPSSPFFEASRPAIEEASGRDGAVMLTQTVPGLLATPALATVLVLDDAATVTRVRNSLPEDRFEVTGAQDATEALSLIHAVTPRAVLVGQALVEDPTLQIVDRIRKDPISDVRHVLLLAHRATQETAARLGCDAWVRKPVEGPLLLALLERLMGQSSDRISPLQDLTEGTVDDIALRLADEIRRGLSESLKVGRDERIEIDDSAELMAAAWSAIGRVRSHLSTRSDGRVRFTTPGPSAAATQSMEGSAGDGPMDSAVADILAGHRVLVADDDPAVVWFFAGLLREAGAEVLEAKNGREALELARLRRPHVIVSDILMPKIDGFALCRELRRDVVLWDVPVILLSWKEDFLLRMRELQSGAAAYLRKEAGSRQILATVAETLKPRVRLRAQLSSDAEVRGRIEQLSVLSVIELVSSNWLDATVTVRDAYNLYEIQLREGRYVSVTRTASDGTFCRGAGALQQALGVRSGRFAVTTSHGALRAPLEAQLLDALQQAAHRMGALLDAVSDKRLLRIGQVEFDDELLSALTDVTPASVMEFLSELQQPGKPLRERLVSGEVVPQVAEDHLRELARAGAITAVWDVDGNDLVGEAFDALSNDPGRLVHVSVPPPRPADADAEVVVTPGVQKAPAAKRKRSDTRPDLLGPQRDTGESAMSELSSQPPNLLRSVLAASEEGAPAAETLDPTPVDANSPAGMLVDAEARPAELTEGSAAADDGAPRTGSRPRRETAVLGFTVESPPELAPSDGSEEPPAESVGAETGASGEVPAGAAGDGGGEVPAVAVLQGEMDDAETPRDWTVAVPPMATSAGASPGDASDMAAAAAFSENDAHERSPAASGDMISRFAMAASFVALAALGYFGFRALGIQQLLRDRRAPSAQYSDVATQPVEPLMTERLAATAPRLAGEVDGIEGDADDGEFGRVVRFIEVHHGIEVAEDEGLLVVNFDDPGEAPTVRVGDKELGAAPVAVALPEGTHEFVIKREGRTRYRHLVIRRGETRVVDVP